MATDDMPEDRLEAALEQIATLMRSRDTAAPAVTPDPVAADVAARLDRIIDTLRDALGQ